MIIRERRDIHMRFHKCLNIPWPYRHDGSYLVQWLSVDQTTVVLGCSDDVGFGELLNVCTQVWLERLNWNGKSWFN